MDPRMLVKQWIRGMFEKGLVASKFDSRLLDVLDLVVLHGTLEKARTATLSMHDVPAHLRDTESVETLWNMARAIPYFKPLFDVTEDAAIRTATSAAGVESAA
jgi:hypothetical protein